MIKEDFNLIKIATKIAVFFAKVDGDYDPSEKLFAKHFIATMQEKNALSLEQMQELEAVEELDATLGDVISETKDVLASIQKQLCRTMFLNTSLIMIEGIIDADGIRRPEEVEAYNIWKKEFKLNY